MVMDFPTANQEIKICSAILFLLIVHGSAPSAMVVSVAEEIYSCILSILAYAGRIGPNLGLFCHDFPRRLVFVTTIFRLGAK